MAYTEVTNTETAYNEVNNEATLWDSNATQWDVTGNVTGTYWDETVITYTEETTNTPTYTEQ